MTTLLSSIWASIWQVWLDTALWLCLGLLFAALAHVYLRTELLERWLAKPGLGSIWRAALLGAPLPLCSCGVLPAAVGLRRAGASKEASAAFLISTPETGVDSMAVSWALLGPFFAIIRPFAALFTALMAGLSVWRFDRSPGQAMPQAELDGSCCGSSQQASASLPQARPSLSQGLAYAFGKMLDDIGGWLIFGVVLAGVILALVPPQWLADVGRSPWALLAMLLVSAPLYVCAVASTPIAAALLVAGVSPGAVLVFLLAGPATNLGGLVLIAKEFGRRFASFYLSAIVSCSLLLGLLVNAFVPAEWLPEVSSHVGQHGKTSALAWAAALGLALWMIYRAVSARLAAKA